MRVHTRALRTSSATTKGPTPRPAPCTTHAHRPDKAGLQSSFDPWQCPHAISNAHRWQGTSKPLPPQKPSVNCTFHKDTVEKHEHCPSPALLSLFPPPPTHTHHHHHHHHHHHTHTQTHTHPPPQHHITSHVRTCSCRADGSLKLLVLLTPLGHAGARPRPFAATTNLRGPGPLASHTGRGESTHIHTHAHTPVTHTHAHTHTHQSHARTRCSACRAGR